jgi:hypothetical protein
MSDPIPDYVKLIGKQVEAVHLSNKDDGLEYWEEFIIFTPLGKLTIKSSSHYSSNLVFDWKERYPYGGEDK